MIQHTEYVPLLSVNSFIKMKQGSFFIKLYHKLWKFGGEKTSLVNLVTNMPKFTSSILTLFSSNLTAFMIHRTFVVLMVT